MDGPSEGSCARDRHGRLSALHFWAVPRTGVALTALLAICSAPIMITAGAALILKERPGRSTLVALLLAVAGTAMVLVGPRAAGGRPPDFTAGAVAAIGAGLCTRGTR